MKNNNTLNVRQDPNILLGGSNDVSFIPVSKCTNTRKKAIIVAGFNSSPRVKNKYLNIKYINRNLYDL
jgi:hypothetical protein|tara:strand:- start:60 stop:263 length:204 start_codon:yes stop_codon:yes gene_type:complete